MDDVFEKWNADDADGYDKIRLKKIDADLCCPLRKTPRSLRLFFYRKVHKGKFRKEHREEQDPNSKS